MRLKVEGLKVKTGPRFRDGSIYWLLFFWAPCGHFAVRDLSNLKFLGKYLFSSKKISLSKCNFSQ